MKYTFLGKVKRVSKKIFDPYHDSFAKKNQCASVTAILLIRATSVLTEDKIFKPISLLSLSELEELKKYSFAFTTDSFTFITTTNRDGIDLGSEDANHMCLVEVGDEVRVEMFLRKSEGFLAKPENRLSSLRINYHD